MMEPRHSPWLHQWLWRASAGQTQPSSALNQTGREKSCYWGAVEDGEFELDEGVGLASIAFRLEVG